MATHQEGAHSGDTEDNERITSGPSSRIGDPGISAEEELRRSSRPNMGIPPSRLSYGHAGQLTGSRVANVDLGASPLEGEEDDVNSEETVIAEPVVRVCPSGLSDLNLPVNVGGDRILRTPVNQGQIPNPLQNINLGAGLVGVSEWIANSTLHTSASSFNPSNVFPGGFIDEDHRKAVEWCEYSAREYAKIEAEKLKMADGNAKVLNYHAEDYVPQSKPRSRPPSVVGSHCSSASSRLQEENHKLREKLKRMEQDREEREKLTEESRRLEEERRSYDRDKLKLDKEFALREQQLQHRREMLRVKEEAQAVCSGSKKATSVAGGGGPPDDDDDNSSEPSSRKSMKPYIPWRESKKKNPGDGGFDDGSKPPSEEDTHPWFRKPKVTTTENAEIDSLAAVIKSVMEKVAESVLPRKEESEVKKILTRQVVGRDLPEFSGNPAQWPMFISSYNQTTKACGFSNVENLHRLIKCLKGPAKDAVVSSLTHPDNVDTVLATLEMRFGRPEDIIESLAGKIRQQPVIKDNDLEGVILFSTAVQNLVSTVKSLKKRAHLQNPLLMRELVQKLPSGVKMRWAEATMTLGEDYGLLEFNDWFSRLAKTLTQISSFSTQDSTAPRKEFTANKAASTPKSNSPSKKKETVLATGTPGEKFCVSCDRGSHEIQECRTFAKKKDEEKMKLVKDKSLCFSCLKPNHPSRRCKERKPCPVDGCGKPHHPSLHRPEKAKEEPKSEDKEVVTCASVSRAGLVLLKILPVTLKGPGGSVETFAMLDEGATTTLVDAEVARQLGASGPKRPLLLTWTTGVEKLHKDSEEVGLDIAGSDGKQYCLSKVRTVPNLALPIQSLNPGNLGKKWKHLEEIDVARYSNARPMILIGSNEASLIVARKTIEGPKNSPLLINTKLGWIIYGNASGLSCKCDQEQVMVMSSEDVLHDMVKDHFRLESDGVRVLDEKPRSKEDKLAQKILQDTTVLKDGRYETGLLWRIQAPVLPDSYDVALRRLGSIERKMDKDPTYAASYCAKIQDYITKGYVEVLPSEKVREKTAATWYLPHFGVVNPNKPTKMRLVFDAAAKSRGRSLNDFLLTGPDLYNSLVDVLFKFRQRKVAFCGDIKEMFHQVLIRDEDLPAQRFLWRGMDRGSEPEIMQMKVMIFGAASSPCSAQFVKNVNAGRFEVEFPRAADAIVHRHYMDDYLDSVDTEEEARELLSQVRQIHKEGGFEICNWIANVPSVLENLKEEEVAPAFKDFSLSGSDAPTERVLGLQWNARTDEFSFNLRFHKVDPDLLQGKKIPTKREFLRVVMSVFDPLGFLAPLTIEAKILMQEIWKSKIDWDDRILEHHALKWTAWLGKVLDVSSIKIPRCYVDWTGDCDLQLHIFADASEKAYSAVGYLRCQKGEQVKVSFLVAKTRVAPVSSISIPRLELQAALMGSRLAQTVVNGHDLEFSKIRLWTDSKTVMCWLNSESGRFKTFVAHRVGEIQENSDVANWRWIPTAANVADDATRTNADLTSNSRWLVGPAFLFQEEAEWPDADVPAAEEENLEVRNVVMVTSTLSRREGLPNPENFSSHEKLIRSTAYVLRFLKMCKGSKTIGTLQPCELEEAERQWALSVQEESYSKEIRSLKEKKPLERDSFLLEVIPFLDREGVLRAKGRQENSEDMDVASRNPIILDSGHPYTRLLVESYHGRNGHQGRETVCNEIRRRFFVPRLRTLIKSVWNRCNHCKVKRAKPIPPLMGDLPEFRVNSATRAFLVSGMDYFGPMQVTIGRRREDRYGVLFTCLKTRAVHLELAHSLTSDSCIMAVRRFIARRGPVQVMYSDNGTNLRGADRELRESLAELDGDAMQRELAKERIEWHFIPPSSPHMGGSWERLVQSVKKAIKSVLKEQSPKPEILQTVFAEAEHMVNSRPLTYVSLDPEDQEALTPNHFLIGPSNVAKPPGIFTDDEFYLRKQWRISQRFADQIWKRWIQEYLPTLTRRSKWLRRVDSPKIGDVAILVDEKNPRNTWPKGIIDAVYPGKDGQVRVVDIRTATGTYRRPMAKIAVLDLVKKGVEGSTPGGSMSPRTGQD